MSILTCKRLSEIKLEKMASASHIVVVTKPQRYTMLNYLWAGMILIGIIYATVTGNLSAVTNAALDSAGEGISLCITTAGVMALWMGLMQIAQEAGLIAKLTRALEPFLSFCFPGIPKGHKSREYIATNIIANILGLGWACTPAGLKAMEELACLEKERPSVPQDTASNEMCTFLILNISSLQLVPVNMIAYRSQYGSAHPTIIIAPAILATFASTLAALIFCKIKDRRRRIR